MLSGDFGTIPELTRLATHGSLTRDYLERLRPVNPKAMAIRIFQNHRRFNLASPV
jgi:hypothetical protein